MNKVTKWLKSCTALLLAAVMVFNMSANVWADTVEAKSNANGFAITDINGDNKITYVTFGDSVTNGYGMTGYRYEDGSNVLGFRREVAGSYPVEIAAYLEEETGMTVDLEQMAISGFRMDELHWMLCDDYEPDYYHTDYFQNWTPRVFRQLRDSNDEEAIADREYYVNKYAGKYTLEQMCSSTVIENGNKASDLVIMSEYREAVEKADFITIDLGTNNFGTFLTSTISSILGTGTIDVTEVNNKTQFSHYTDEKTAATLDNIIDQMAAKMAGGATSGLRFDLTRTLARCMMFGYLGFTENYDGALDALYKINPDAQVIVIDMYTMISGVELLGEALGNVDLDELYNMFVDMANFYANELSPYAQKVTHASLTDGDPALLIDDFAVYKYPDSQGALVQIPERDEQGNLTGKYNNDYNETAVTLLDEFIMETGFGYDPDNPEHRKQFYDEIGNNIRLLDSYVYDLQGIIRTLVLEEQVNPQIDTAIEPNDQLVRKAIDAIKLIYTAVDGVAAAEEAVTTAVDGTATAKAAVATAKDGVATAEAAVTTAVEGVATAQQLVNVIVDKVVNNSAFSTSSILKSTVISVIKSNLESMDLESYGFDDGDVDMLAEEVYKIACDYKNTSNKTEANKAAVIEIIRFKLLNTANDSDKVYTEEEALATAQLAYAINEVYQANGEKEAVLYAMETEITEELMALLGVSTKRAAAEKAYSIAKMNDKDAVIEAMKIKVDENTAKLAYEINAVYENAEAEETGSGRKAAVIYTVKSQLKEEDAQAVGLTLDELAVMAYELAGVYNTAYESNKAEGEEAAKKAATIQALVAAGESLGMTVDAASAELAYTVYTKAYVPAMEAGATDESAKDKAVIKAIELKMSVSEAVAEGLFGIYKDKKDLSYEQEIGAYTFAMVGVAGMDEALVKAILNCYRLEDGTNLNGYYNDSNVKTTMTFLMTQALSVDAATAEGLYGSYLTYKNVASTLGKIARLKEIYFDSLLFAASSGGIKIDDIAAKIQADELVLEKPVKGADESEADFEKRMAQFMSDSSLAIFYFRFMAQDGVYTHPSISGHQTFVTVIKKAINNMVPKAQPDSDISIGKESSILSIGDAMVASDKEGNYTQLIADKLGLSDKVTYVQNDVARLEDFYHALNNGTGDAFAEEVVKPAGQIDGSALEEQIKANDIILINLGSMNLGYSAMQLAKYGAAETSGQTYKMTFGDKANMSVRNLGARVDTFLAGFQKMIGVGGDATAVGNIMLLLESYGYGITTYANDFNNFMEAIRTLNPNATIILTGVGNIAGDTYYYDGAAHLELGHFYQHGAELLNGHMEKYAAQTAGVFYIDTMDAENTANKIPYENRINIAAEGVNGLLDAAHFTTKGHETVADKFNCEYFGVHIMKDTSKAPTCTEPGTVEQTCISCDERKTGTVSATGHDYGEWEETLGATCTEAGEKQRICSVCENVETEEIPELGHTYNAPVWTWTEDHSGATATFTCSVCNEDEAGHVVVKEATSEKTTIESDCVNNGSDVYVVTVELNGQTYTDTYSEGISANGHTYGQPTWTWNAEFTEATATFTCTVDGCKGNAIEKASGDAITAQVTKEATCTTAGTKDLTATVTFEDVIYKDTKTNVTIPATGVHNYVDGECTMCGDVEHKVDCTYKEETALKAGELTLVLGGTEVGSYTFEQVSGGWTIKGENGYLALADGALTTSSTAFTWTYDNGMFSATETTETTSSSNNWWNNIFGGILGGIIGGGNTTTTTTTTYYLVTSGSTLTVSTGTTGAAATFYVKHNDGNANHNYVEKVVNATCTTDGYTEYTCTKCGTSYKKNIVTATGHNYTAKVTEPTCTTPGYTEYTCQNGCGDTYKSDETPAKGHNFVDGTCTACGEEEEGECVGTKEASLTSGLTAQLTLNGANVGTFTFTQVDGGWTIRANDGRYVGKEGAYTSEAFVWTYSNNSFSYTVTTETSSSSNNWLNSFLGGIFGGGTTTTTTTYYLVASNGAPAVSTSAATAKFLVVSTGDHVYGDPVSKDGKHVFTCTVCGHVKEVVCTDENCTLCHPVTPEEPDTPEVPEANVNVSVSVTSKTESTSSNNWFNNIFGGIFGGGSSSKTTYTATINVTAEGTEVKKVEYSTDGTNWTEGTSFTSDSNITKFYIRVTGTNTVVYEFTYANGSVTEGLPEEETPDTPPVTPEEPEEPEEDDDDNSSSGNWWENIFGSLGNWFN